MAVSLVVLISSEVVVAEAVVAMTVVAIVMKDEAIVAAMVGSVWIQTISVLWWQRLSWWRLRQEGLPVGHCGD